MAYEKTQWNNGDNISADKLNKMEAGIEYGCSLEHEITDPVDGQVMKYDATKGKWVNAEAPSGGSEKLIVNVTQNTDNLLVLDKTWQEIYDAMPNVIIHIQNQGGDDTFINIYGLVSAIGKANGLYRIVIIIDMNETTFTAESATEYPAEIK